MTRMNKMAVAFGLTILSFGLSQLSAQDLKTAIRLTESEQFEDAWKVYDQLIKSEPQNSDYYYYFGESYLKSYFGDTATIDLAEMIVKSKKLFQKGIEVLPSNPLNYVGLGKAALYAGDTLTAKNEFKKAVSLLPTKKNKIVLSNEKQVVTYQKIAEAYLKAPKKDTAFVFPPLMEAQRLNKKDPETYILRGDAYLFILNDGSNAILNYKRAQELDPSSPKAKMKLGQLWVRGKRYMDALDYYNEAIKLDSMFTPAYRELAELYAMAGQYENAKKNYARFLELSDKNLYAKVRYASFLFLTKDYNDAISQINEVLTQDPSYNFLNRLAAYSYYETGQADKALTSIETFFNQTKPEKIITSDYSYYGKIYSKLGKDSLAIEKYKLAWNRDTTNLDLLGDMITSYNKLKWYNETANIYLWKIRNGKAVTQDYQNLGKAYYYLQSWNKSDSAFSYVIANKPDYLPAYLWKARVYSNLDPETTEGLAKPHYELVVEKAMVDTVKNSRELLEAYSYLAYYYFKNKKYCESLTYWQKIEAIDPASEKAKDGIKTCKLKCPGK